MQQIEQPGGRVWVAEAPDWVNGSKTGHLNIAIDIGQMTRNSERGLTWALGQMYGVVGTGLIFTEHLFRGLRRDMYVRDDKDAAKRKLAATWPAPRDAELVGSPDRSELRYLPAPQGRIFVVYISPNGMLTEFPDVYGWAEHWTWLAADPELAGAPIDWESRYDERVWSREAP